MPAGLVGSAIATRVRNIFGDASGVQLTDAMIIEWINDGIREIGAANNINQQVFSTSTVIGDFTYALPSDATGIRSVKIDGTKIRPLSVQEIDEYVPSNAATNRPSGRPYYWWVVNEQINLYPTPDAIYTFSILFTEIPQPIALIDESLPIPTQYHTAVLAYVLAQAYEMDEDWAAADRKRAQFQDKVMSLKGDSELAASDFYGHIVSTDEVPLVWYHDA